MKLLDFNMPTYSRVYYGSKTLKEQWEAKLAKAKKTYNILEIESVKHGLRKCTTAHVPGQDLANAVVGFAKNGLIFLPIQKVGAYSGSANTHPPVEEGKPWSWYGVLSNDMKSASEFVEATKEGDHKALGRLLGYPESAVEFFDKTWKQDGYVDPVWQITQNTSKDFIKNEEENLVVLDKEIPWELNTFLRPINVRLIPHIPASFDCEESLKMARDWLALGEKLKVEGLGELIDILKMPMEWNALKGIGYVSTPTFKVEHNTVTCYPKYIVQRKGTIFPEESPRGLKFPWTERWAINGSLVDRVKKQEAAKKVNSSEAKSCGCGGNCQCGTKASGSSCGC